MTADQDVIASISASPPRRWLAIACLVGLAILMIWIGLVESPSPGWRVVLLALGGGTLWVGDRMRRATERVIELTATELRDSSGVVIARIEDIASVDRSMFAFKPSNGFLIRLRQSAGPGVWNPGLWWRIGSRVGVGGVTPASQTKFTADMLKAMLAERDGLV